MTPAQTAKARAHLSDLFERPDAAEIAVTAFRIARREYTGAPESILLGISDDDIGCLLCRAAARGDTEAISLRTKIPRLHAVVATSEQMKAKAAIHPYGKGERRFWEKMRRATGGALSPEAYLEIYAKLRKAMEVSHDTDHIGNLLMEELWSRGYRGKDLRRIGMFIAKVLEKGED